MGIGDILTGWTWSSLLLALFVIMIGYYMYPVVFPRVTGVPGPMLLPVFGSMIPYLKNGRGFQDIINIKKYGKVFKLLEARCEILVISDLEILKHILVKDFKKFTNRQNLTELKMRGYIKWALTDSEDATWRRQRHLLTHAFTSARLKEMIPMVNECADQLIKSLELKAKNSEKVDIRSFTGAFTLDFIASSAFGLKLDAQNDPNNLFITKMKKLLNIKITNPAIWAIYFFQFLIPLFDKVGVCLFSKDAMEFYKELVERTIQERKQDEKPREDFLQLMLDAEKHELDEEAKEDLKGVEADEEDTRKGLSSTEVLAQAVVFFGAGYETTASALAFLLYNLATNQDCQDKLHQEICDVMKDYDDANCEAIAKMAYLEKCILETLRMFPPVSILSRRAGQDTDIEGLHIPEGVMAFAPIYALHHDPDIWPQPEKFDPERFSPQVKQERSQFSYMPFGIGPRQCIGKRLALIEMKLAMVKIIQKFKFKDAGVPLEVDTRFMTKSKSGIWVYAEVR